MRLAPLLSGGGQERGLRSGTLPAPLVVGFGEAARIAAIEGTLDAGRIGGQRDRFLAALQAAVPGVELNAPDAPRVTGNLKWDGVDTRPATCPLEKLMLSPEPE